MLIDLGLTTATRVGMEAIFLLDSDIFNSKCTNIAPPSSKK